MIEETSSIYIIGDELERLDTTILPSNKEVLRLLFYKRNFLKLTLQKSLKSTITDVFKIWNQLGRLVCRKDSAISRLKRLHQKWKSLQKNHLRALSEAQTLNEANFTKKLDNLFDISGRYVPTIPVVDTCVDQIASCSSVDANTVEIMEKDIVHSCSHLSISDEPLSQSTNLSQNELKRSISSFAHEKTYNSESKVRKKDLVTSELAAALDRTNTTSRSASYILTAAVTALGLNPDHYNLSKSAIHERRNNFRTERASELKENIQLAESLVVHWDGKILPELDGPDMSERLPVVVSGLRTEQLLGVPILDSGSGNDQATAIIEMLNLWGCSDRVKAICFDTTSSNTGPEKGTCVQLVRKLDRDLLHLACRHHVYEIILRKVFETYLPRTSGPNVPIFTRFKKQWSDIDKAQFKNGLDDAIIAETVDQKKEEILRFVFDQLEISHPRGDYKELLELTCIFLGGTPPRGAVFKKPGAMHHARWLSKAIYSLKMFMFRSLFRLTAKEMEGLRHICIFIVIFYVKSWFMAPFAIMAPSNDLNLLQELMRHREINAKVSDAALNKLTRHLWYLSEHLAPLAFFDNTVSRGVKLKMVAAIKNRESLTERRIRAEVDLRDVISYDLSDFITKESVFLFDQFNLPYDFLDKNPEQWETEESYQNCFMIFKDLKVVNDIAERAIALIEEYNQCLTKDQQQQEYLLRIVAKHRNDYPNCNKKTLCNTSK